MEGENQFNNQQSIDNSVTPPASNFIDIRENTPIDPRSAKEKVTVALVIVVSFLALILGVTQFSSTLRRPLTQLALLAAQEGISTETSALLDLQQKDTDGDGLMDYDELNIYSTSPYLADSDSDGISDKEEIDTGHDPNCPGTDTCFRTDTAGLSQTFSATDAQNILSANSDPQVLREVLIKNGFPKDQLDAISDADLVATYQQALAGQTPNQASTDLSQTNITSIDDLKSLTGAQIRQLMIEQGADASVLASISDEELKTMFLTKLNSPSN